MQDRMRALKQKCDQQDDKADRDASSAKRYSYDDANSLDMLAIFCHLTYWLLYLFV